MNEGLALSILLFLGLAMFVQTKKNTVENFAGMPYPMTWKVSREVSVPRCNQKPKMFSVSGNYQSSLSPRFSNVSGYGSRIRYRKPCREVMGVPEHPLSYYKNTVDSCNPCPPSTVDSRGCTLAPLCDLGRIDVNDNCQKKCPQSATVSSMLPVTDMRTINMMAKQQTRENFQAIEGGLKCNMPSSVCEDNQQPIVYDRLIYANARSRLRGQSDWIRGDLPIVPVLPESNPDSLVMFRPSVAPSIDLNQGALNVLGGYDNTSMKQLQTLMAKSTDGTLGTFSGCPINNQQITCNSASDVVVSSFL
jgi:hypothetical protein